MRCRIKFVHAKARHESAVETYAATRRAPMTLAVSGTPEGMLISLFIKPWATVLATVVVAALVYVAGGLGVAWWLEREPHNRIHAGDLMLPWRWSMLADLHGQTLCAQGADAVRRGEVAQGIFSLQSGLATHPNDPAARLILAESLAKQQDYEGVRDAVLPQLAFAPVPRSLLTVLVNEALRVDDAATVADCGEALARNPASPVDHEWLQLRRADALLALRRRDAALTVLAEPAFAMSGEAAERRVIALCALGRADEALALAGTMPAASPTDLRRRWRMLARAQREAGRKNELAQSLAELVALDPANVESRLFAIEQYRLANLRDEARRELDLLLQRVRSQPGGIESVVSRLGDAGAPDLIKRCIEAARAAGQSADPFLAVWAGAAIQAADWVAAEEAFTAIYGASRVLSDRDLRLRPVLRATIDAGEQGTRRALIDLKSALEIEPLPLTNYVRSAEGLARGDRWEAVQIVTEIGLRTFRRSAALQRLARESRGKPAAPAKAAPVSAEPAVSPVEARGTDISKLDAASFTARLNEHLQREQWDAAAALITAVRRAEPAWSRAIAPELDWAEARVAFARDDRVRAVQMIGFGLKWHRKGDVERALSFARDYQARDNRDAALAVVRRVLEIDPESTTAQRLKTELEGK